MRLSIIFGEYWTAKNNMGRSVVNEPWQITGPMLDDVIEEKRKQQKQQQFYVDREYHSNFQDLFGTTLQ
jgi:hypothetical protein